MSVRELMTSTQGGFGDILKRARAIDRLNQRVSRLLESDLAQHCQLANVRNRTLIFACDSPACATRLRFHAPKLLDELHAAGLEEIEAIEVKMMI